MPTAYEEVIDSMDEAKKQEELSRKSVLELHRLNNEQDYRAWLKHPITQRLIQELKDRRQKLIQSAEDDIYKTNQSSNLLIKSVVYREIYERIEKPNLT